MAFKTLTASLLGLGLLAGCAPSPTTVDPEAAQAFRTQQVIIDDGQGPYGLFSPFGYPYVPYGLTDPWIFTPPYYSSLLMAASLYPAWGYGGYGCGGYGYGGYGYGGYGCGGLDYGGFGKVGGHGRIGGIGHHGGRSHRGSGRIAEQNAVAYRPAGSKIWRPKK